MNKAIWTLSIVIFLGIGIYFFRYNDIGNGLYIDRFSSNLVTSYLFSGKKLVIENVDAKSFQKVSTWRDYWLFKDKNHVYYIGNVSECYGCIIPKERILQWYILDWVDPKTFEILSPLFIKDKDRVFYSISPIYPGRSLETFKEIEWIDSQNTKMISWSIYALKNALIEDTHNVYLLSWNKLQTFSWADPSTFQIVNFKYFKDKFHTYELVNWEIVTKSWDIQILGIAWYRIYSKDKNNVYFQDLYDDYGWGATSIQWADVNTFQIAKDWIFTKDKSNVYYIYYDSTLRRLLAGKIEGADADTFDISGVQWKDKNSTYVLKDGYIYKDGVKQERPIQNYNY